MTGDEDAESERRPFGTTGASGADWALSAAGRASAEAFLTEHTRLAREQADVARLQAEGLRREDSLRHWSLRVRHISDVMKLAFELALAFIVIVIAAGIGAAIWAAADDRGLVIEAFSVPPDLSSRGVTGEVVAARLLDKLAALQAETVSNRAASSYANNWDRDIKLQIPETGISIGEFNRTLHALLGHQTRITGEIYHTGNGIVAVTARAGSDTSPTFTGNDADLDKLLQQVAESVYRATQPYRYAVYLANAGRAKEAESAYTSLITNGSVQDRAWAYVGLSNLYTSRPDFIHARAALDAAEMLRPDFIMAVINKQNIEAQLQHDEAGLALAKRLVVLAERRSERDINDAGWAIGPPTAESTLAGDLGDFQAQLIFDRRIEGLPEFNRQVENARDTDTVAFASLHDHSAMEQWIAALPPSANPQIVFQRNITAAFADLSMGRWQTLLRMRAPLDSFIAKLGPLGDSIAPRQLWPGIALALALSGDLREAHALIDKTPVDCAICLRYRGQIDGIEKNWGGGNYWFSRAVHDAPSPPFAWTDWGAMLLVNGDFDAAIEKFRTANLKGPHFADPLEMWGEALIQENRSDLALAKFEEANKYATHWGRLHLKWGEALIYLGKKDEARKQFEIASRLDMAPTDAAALARARATHV